MLELCYGNSEELQVGIDEAGRGCFAGPVVAAVVLWDNDWIASQLSEAPPCSDNTDMTISQEERQQNKKFLELIKDSKKLSKKNRDLLFKFITDHAKAYSIQYISEGTIDKVNILNATYLAMHNALDVLNKYPIDRILVDGDKFLPYKNTNPEREYLNVPHLCVPNGDNTYLSIASASILAKVSRDWHMEQLAKENPELDTKYDWFNNKGYGTKKHLDGIRAYGICEHHRRTFGICKEF